MARDYSETSLQILREKTSQYLKENHNIHDVWFPDLYEEPNTSLETVDVVLFGSFLKRFLETGNWVNSKYRFWCVGGPTYNFFTEIVGMNKNQIRVIPRDKLLRPKACNLENLSKDEEYEFVYAGRISPSKKILTLIWTVKSLQELGYRVKLNLFGEFIREEKFCDCPESISLYEREVLNLISLKDWEISPIFHGKVQFNEWVEKNWKNPVYISLSVLPFEDFSVSVAQAQSQSWPVILNDWGAHLDVTGRKLSIPLGLFQSSQETSEDAKVDGQMLASYITKKNFTDSINQSLKVDLPEVTTLEDLDKKRRSFLLKWGTEMQDLIRNRTYVIEKNPHWNVFLLEYIKCFTRKYV